MSKARILCVDDDKPTVMVIANVLKKEGYEVETALDGFEGVRKARAFKPHLVVLDIMMPGMDGYQVCSYLKGDPDTAKTAILMLTAKGGIDNPTNDGTRFAFRVQDRLKGFDAGAVEFLTKPIKAKDLVQRVKAVLWTSGLAV
ncbi:MAG TPA: response regulator [Anaerolineae bacterium]|nr:response regulator [Anaerolineae bacterium]